jgi:RNA polymerase sigma factor for flagellar operon FliA
MNSRSTSTPLQQLKTLQVRDEIILQHLPLAKAIAVRVHENLPVHVDLDDLVHAGVLGLFDAVAKYDAEKNVAFQAYAKHRIKGAILDSLRQLDWASRDLRKRQKQVDSTTRDLSASLGRNPTEHEVAQRMGVTTDRLRRMQMDIRTVGVVSMTAISPEDRDRTEDFAGTPDLQPDRICERKQLQGTLARALDTLPERYRKVVFLYYTTGLTMKEIGDLMGVNESRVSQIHKSALKKMQLALESQGIQSTAAI